MAGEKRTWERDLAWQNIELMYHSSVAHAFARYALNLEYKLVPEDVLHEIKRSLLDTLGCAIGGYEAEGRLICESAAQKLGGPQEATVFCSGMRTSAINATLVNTWLACYLNYMLAHAGASLPAILAVAESEKSNGRDFLTSAVISFELGERFNESKRIEGEVEGTAAVPWCHDIFAGLSVPPALGKLMGMTEEQIANAIGACACHSLPLGILDANGEENQMMREMRLGAVVHNVIFYCVLAKNGFTGPIRVVEGENGMNQVLYGGKMNFQRLLDFSGWRTLHTKYKPVPGENSSIAHVLATTAIVKENNLKPEDIAAVWVRDSTKDWAHTTGSLKKYPRNAESAGHSAFWMTAAAIKGHGLSPESYRPENFTDPVIFDLINKITVEPDRSMPSSWMGGESRITTKDGRVFQKRIENVPGLSGIPFTDVDLEEKFRGMASKHMSERQIKQIFNTIWNVEKLDDISKLTKLMIFPSR